MHSVQAYVTRDLFPIMYAYVKRGVEFSCDISFGCFPIESRCGNVPNELVHRAQPPFLDDHYCGYQ